MEEEHRKYEEMIRRKRSRICRSRLAPMPTEDDYIPDSAIDSGEGEIEESENSTYIMGKPSKAKEKHITVKELSAESGRVTLEGRVISSFRSKRNKIRKRNAYI